MGPRAVNVDFTGAISILVYMSNVLCPIYSYIYTFTFGSNIPTFTILQLYSLY